MIDGDAVMQTVVQGSAPAHWRVYPAKRSYFLGTIVWGAIGVVLFLGFLGFLVLNPDFVFGLKGTLDEPSLQVFWRVFDLVATGVLALAFAVLLRTGLRELGSVKQQALVVLPEGFVEQTGTDQKTRTVIEFGAITSIAPRVYRGRWMLVMPRANGTGVVTLRLDPRFGSPKTIAMMLQEARNQYGIATSASAHDRARSWQQ